MSSAEAIEVVHQMMDARERERAALLQQACQTKDPSAARRKFWKEVAVYPLALAYAVMYALLMAVLQ